MNNSIAKFLPAGVVQSQVAPIPPVDKGKNNPVGLPSPASDLTLPDWSERAPSEVSLLEGVNGSGRAICVGQESPSDYLTQIMNSDGIPVFLTGGAGTGKSTLIKNLVSQVEGTVVLATTSAAAFQVGGQTVHSFFKLPVGEYGNFSVPSFSPEKKAILRKMDRVVIDEVSMMTPDMVDHIDCILRKVREDESPFGGVKILFTGDLLQIPPVISDPSVSDYFNHNYGGSYFLLAKSLLRSRPHVVSLNKVHRQNNQTFIEVLSRVRVGRHTADDMNYLNRNCDRAGEVLSNYTRLFPTKKAVDSLNSEELKRLPGDLYSYEAEFEGDLAIGFKAKECPAPNLLEIKEGAKVVFVTNGYPRWSNGTRGKVIRASKDLIEVEIEETGAKVDVARHSWSKYSYDFSKEKNQIEKKEVGAVKQFPLALAYALTIHKAQGMTLSKVSVDLQRCFQDGQSYVALSRSTSVEGLHLAHSLRSYHIKASPRIVGFYENLHSKSKFFTSVKVFN